MFNNSKFRVPKVELDKTPESLKVPSGEVKDSLISSKAFKFEPVKNNFANDLLISRRKK